MLQCCRRDGEEEAGSPGPDTLTLPGGLSRFFSFLFFLLFFQGALVVITIVTIIIIIIKVLKPTVSGEFFWNHSIKK